MIRFEFNKYVRANCDDDDLVMESKSVHYVHKRLFDVTGGRMYGSMFSFFASPSVCIWDIFSILMVCCEQGDGAEVGAERKVAKAN